MTRFKYYAATAALVGASVFGLAACGGTSSTATPLAPTAAPTNTMAAAVPTDTTAAMMPTDTAMTGSTTSGTATIGTSATSGTSGASGSGDATTLINQAAQAMKGVTAYHISMNISGGTSGGSTSVITATGDIQTPNSTRLNMDMSALGGGSITVLEIAGDTYTQVPGTDSYMKTPGGANMSQVNPSDFTAVTNIAQNAQIVGDETINGVATTHVTFSYSLDQLATASGQATPGVTMGTSNADLWIGKSDHYIYREKLVLSGSSSTTTATPGTDTSTVTVDISNFNETINPPIVVPTNLTTMPGTTDTTPTTGATTDMTAMPTTGATMDMTATP